jgi:hypothetical protein
MNHHIVVSFGDDREYEFELRDADTANMTWEAAQRWIDEEYVKTGQEAARPVGTVLLSEKILCIAKAHGPRAFATNGEWAICFARCAGKAIGRISITLDAGRHTVGL